MSEIFVTLILVGFVIGGGLFIFWPDLLSFFKKPQASKKKNKKTDQLVKEIYEKHYTTEDAFLEAAHYAQNGQNLDTMKRLIEKRGENIRFWMENPNNAEHPCPICNQQNIRLYNEMKVSCRCHDGKFARKVKQMLRDVGHAVW